LKWQKRPLPNHYFGYTSLFPILGFTRFRTGSHEKCTSAGLVVAIQAFFLLCIPLYRVITLPHIW